MDAENKKLVVIVVFIVVAVGIGATLLLVPIQNDSTLDLGTQKDARPIRIAFSPWIGDAPLVLAANEFKKNNVLVELVLTENATKAEELYVNGLVDGLSSIYTNTIFHNSEGVNSRLVWVIDYSGTADVILGSQNTTIADLKGKKIGIEGINTFSHIFVLKALDKAGLYENDVQFEDIPAQDILKALDNKQIEAGHTWGPTKLAAIQSGYKILATAKDVPGIITDVLIFNSKIVDTRPEDIEAIVKSINQGKEYLDSNKEKSSQVLSNFFNMTREEVQDGFEGIQILGLKDNVEAMNKSSNSNMTSLYQSGDIIAKYLLDRGQIRQMPDFDEIIDPGFVYTILNNNSKKS
jgi:NitT/TauT family transport system substrate-binding protein